MYFILFVTVCWLCLMGKFLKIEDRFFWFPFLWDDFDCIKQDSHIETKISAMELVSCVQTIWILPCVPLRCFGVNMLFSFFLQSCDKVLEKDWFIWSHSCRKSIKPHIESHSEEQKLCVSRENQKTLSFPRHWWRPDATVRREEEIKPLPLGQRQETMPIEVSYH